MMMNEVRPLPDSWIWASLNSITEDIYRYPSFYGMEHLTEGVPVIRGEHILKDGSVSHDWENYWFVSQEIADEFPRTTLQEGDLVMSVRGSVGKIGIIDHLLQDAQLSPNCIRVAPDPSVCESKYLLYYLKSSNTQSIIQGQTNATTIQTIKASVFKSTPVPIAPLQEQKHIVDEIEKQFTRLDQAVASLQRLQSNLARYKASVLKAACNGRLVPQDPNDEPAAELLTRILAERRAQWEAANPGKKYKEPVGVETAVLPDLPEGWVWATMDSLADIVSGVAKGRKFQNQETVHLPYLRVANVQQGYLDLSEIKEIEARPDELEKYRLQENDLLLTEGGDWDKLGRSAIWKAQIPDCIHQNHIFRARPWLSDLSTVWLMFVTNSEHGRKYFANSSKQTTNLASINLTQLRACPIPLPSKNEIERIVAEVERRLSVVSATEQTIIANLSRAERLRQSILHRAFTGQLVPQHS